MLATYTVADESLCAGEADALLALHRDEIADILQASSLEATQARSLLGEPIEAFVRHVGRLPATRDRFYAAPAGLLRLGLDCALLTARKAQGWEFSGLGQIERRRVEAPRWRVACILAGLLYDMHRTVTECVVWGTDGPWVPVVEPLTSFAARQPEARVRLTWRRRGSTATAAAEDLSWNLPFVPKVIDDSILEFLYEGDQQIVADLFAVLSGEAAHRPSNSIHPLVHAARARLIAQDEEGRGRSVATEQAPAGNVSPPAATPAEPHEDPSPSHAVQQTATSATEAKGEVRDARSITAISALDYSTQLLVKEIQKVLARPKSARGNVQLTPEGTLCVRGAWIRALGFDISGAASRLERARWLEASSMGSGASEDSITLNARVSRLLLGTTASSDLLTARVDGGKR